MWENDSSLGLLIRNKKFLKILKKSRNRVYGFFGFLNARNRGRGEVVLNLYSRVSGPGPRSAWPARTIQLPIALLGWTCVIAHCRLSPLLFEWTVSMLRNVNFMALCRHVTREKPTLARKHKLWGQMLCHKIHEPWWYVNPRSGSLDHEPMWSTTYRSNSPIGHYA